MNDDDRKFKMLVSQTMLALLDGEIYQRETVQGCSHKELSSIFGLRDDVDDYLLSLLKPEPS